MKTAKELFKLLNSFDEDRRIEAKSASAVGKSMMETVCAFSNEPGLRGGYLLLGAKRVGMAGDGKPIYEPENIGNSDKIQSDFVAMCNSMFAEYDLVNEQKLALVFVREVGAIDNATYRQLDTTITHARARLELHKLCELGFLLKKGQGRNTYYIKTEKVVSLGEMLPPNGEKIPPQGGMFHGKQEIYHGEEEKSGEIYHGKQEIYHGEEEKSGEIYHGEEKIYHALSRDSLIAELPEELKRKILEIKKWTAKEDMDQIIISLCSLRPYSIDELKVILQRNQKALKSFKIKALLESKQLFYWIPEMIRHPQQKYIANPSMARSKTKNNNKNDHK